MEAQKYDAEHTFHVQVSDEEIYVIDGQLKPVIYVKLGDEYIFNIDAERYPMVIGTSAVGGDGGEGIDTGYIIFKCTQEVFDTQHYYQCTLRKQMGYKIIVLRD
jgi:hypothetical protein